MTRTNCEFHLWAAHRLCATKTHNNPNEQPKKHKNVITKTSRSINAPVPEVLFIMWKHGIRMYMAYGFAFGVPASLYRALIKQWVESPPHIKTKSWTFLPVAHVHIYPHPPKKNRVIHPSSQVSAQGTRSNFVRPLIPVKTSTDPTDQTNGSESPVDRTRKPTRLWGSGLFGGWGDENREFLQRCIVVDVN